MPVAVGNTNLFFSRDTKVFIEQGTNIWEIPVLNGYSFSQTTNASTITLNEMSDATGRSRRGQRTFNDSLSPAEWSFDTYVRPTLVNTKMRVADEILWASMANNVPYSPTIATTPIAVSAATISGSTLTITHSASGGSWKVNDIVKLTGLTSSGGTIPATAKVLSASSTTTTVEAGTATGTVTVASATINQTSYTSTATEFDFNFLGSNTTTLGTFNLYFVLGGNQQATNYNYLASGDTTIYKIAECSANEVTINFEIDGIATFSWSGMGKTMTEVAAFDASSAIKSAIYTGSTLITNNLIRNRLTGIKLSRIDVAKTYTLAITGGSITISNNITFLTPESLGVVNHPLGHVTGTRSVTGNFSAYLDEALGGSKDLYADLVASTSTITNVFTTQFFVGGMATGGLSPVGPGVMFDMGQCNLEIPTINNDDVIALDVNFTALPSNISGADEITKVRFVGIAP
jgi:hypothetical protein